MQIIQYMSIHRVPLLLRYLQKMLLQKSTIILDLEATLSSVDQAKAKDLKAWGRAELVTLAHAHPDLFKNAKVGIRVNSFKSGELERDIEAIAELSKIWAVQTIVGPMIESRECIDKHLACLESKKICFSTFIPIIETVKGVKNLASIASHEKISQAQYGHQDYCLDLGIWPFYEQDETAFWDIVSHFIQEIEAKGLNYIHPPVSDIFNETLFVQIYQRLRKLCTLPFSMITINRSQATLFNQLQSLPPEAVEQPLRTPSFSLEEKTNLALHVKKICSPKERNFLVDPVTRKFFAPHKYIAALQFLEQIHE